MQLSKKISVLLVWPNISYFGNNGGSVHLRGLISSLKKRVDLGVICKCGKDFSKGGVKFFNVSCGRNSLLELKRIKEISKDYEILCSRADPFELSGLISAKILKKKIIGEVNVNFLAYEKKGNKRDLLYPLFHLVKYFWVKIVLPRYDYLICVSETIRKSLVRRGLQKEKINTIHNGGGFGKCNLLEIKKIRKKFGLSEKETVFLLAGELGPRQGLKEILEIDFSKFKKNIGILFVGGSPRYSEFINLMKQKSKLVVKKYKNVKIFFTGSVPYNEIKGIICASDVILAPYRESDNKELFGFSPIKVLEAMSFGKPVLASDREWIREVLTEKEGFLNNNLSKGFEEVLKSKKLKEKGMSGLAKIKEKFSWDNSAENYYKLIKNLVNFR